MATFQFSDHSINLDFGDNVSFRVELTSDLQDRVASASEMLSRKSVEGSTGLSDVCDSVMNAIDIIIGEGAAEEILSMKDNFTAFDAMDVFKYITDEINRAVREEAKRYQAEAQQPANRAQRRAARHNHDLYIPPHNHAAK